MSLPIRAFLMIRSGPNEWTVDVCRDLDAVIAAWHRRTDASAPAVLHLGFDRPHSMAFEEIASAYPGRMLLTASAKYGVPCQFDASENPVGQVDRLPVFLALRGWGYVENEGTEPEPTKAQLPELSQGWSDWVVSFIQARPELVEDLQTAQVISEASYLANEAALPWEVRYRSGLFRFGHLIVGEDDDPCAIVRAAPPWLGSRKLEDLELTVRLRNVFFRAQFTTVGDIGRVALGDLFMMSNFGRKSAADLKKILLDAMEEGPNNNSEVVREVTSGDRSSNALSTLIAELHRTLALCETRECDILIRRMGLGCSAETLESLAKNYGITRERVRQIEAKATKRIIRRENWDDILAAKMERLLASRDYPLPVLGLEAVDAWFAGVSEEGHAFRYLLDNFCGNRVSVTEIGGVQYLGFLTQDEWRLAVHQGTRILKYAADKNWSEEHIQSLLHPVLPEKSREFRSLLWTELSKHCHFSTGDQGERVLASFGQGIEPAVEALLADADSPLHFSEIAKRLEHRMSKTIDVRRAHIAAANVGILLGRGLFGAEKHLNSSPGELERIADEATRIILNGPPGRQWHSAELLSGLIDCGLAGEHLNKYVVDFALRKSPDLTRLGRMSWVASDDITTGERIEIREAVQSVIIDAGRPLTVPEIRQRLVALRGVSDNLQFSFSDPIIRVGLGLWGLNDRDVPVSRSDQPALFDHLVARLKSNGQGMHISEVKSGLDCPWSDVPPQIVFSLGILDERLKVSVGQFLYLTEWGEPRREALYQIIQRLVDRAVGNFTSSEIIKQVERESTLPIDTSYVSSCIRSAGATYNGNTRTWAIDQTLEEIAFDQAD